MTLGSRALVTLYGEAQVQSQEQEVEQEVKSNNLHCDPSRSVLRF